MTLVRRDLLKELAESSGLSGNVKGSIDIVGDIAILRTPIWIEPVPKESLEKIAVKLMDRLPYVKSVWLAASPVSGEERVRELVYLAGEKRTTTIYREHGVSFFIDVAKVYISPRLSYEHLRIAKLVKPGEVVTNFFSGIGGFSLVIAKNSEVKLVNSIDINKYAVEMQRESIKMNKLDNKVRVYLGDARTISDFFLKESSNRVLLPLPGIDESFYKAALSTIKGDAGWLHVYEFVPESPEFSEGVEEKFQEIHNIALKYGWAASLYHVRKVRSVGPRKAQVVMDIRVERYH